MNENSNPLFRPLAAGDWVIVRKNDEYAGLSGIIKEVIPFGSPVHETGNPTDDVTVDLSVLDYSDGMMDEIVALAKDLGYDIDSYDDVAIGNIILAPEDLIQITDDELTQYYAELGASMERASAVGEMLSAQHFDEIYKAFTDRVEQNYADYERDMLGFGAREIFDMAARIHAVSDAYSYLTTHYNFLEEELRFYMQFQNPLDIIAQAWHERNMDMIYMAFTMNYLWGRRGSVLVENALVREAQPEPGRQPEPAEPPRPLTAREQLYDKMSAEYKGFLAEMKSKPASDIIEAAYEKVFKEDLLLTIDSTGLGEKQIAALLTLDTPLADLYWNWLDADTSHMDMLLDSVTEYADAVIKELEAEQAKTEAPKKQHEPEKPQQYPASKQPPSLLGEVREAAREVEARKAAQPAPAKIKTKENELS